MVGPTCRTPESDVLRGPLLSKIYCTVNVAHPELLAYQGHSLPGNPPFPVGSADPGGRREVRGVQIWAIRILDSVSTYTNWRKRPGRISEGIGGDTRGPVFHAYLDLHEVVVGFLNETRQIWTTRERRSTGRRFISPEPITDLNQDRPYALGMSGHWPGSTGCVRPFSALISRISPAVSSSDAG